MACPRSEGACRWATIDLSGGSGATDVRVVEAPDARSGRTSVEEWAGYVAAVHARWTGENFGWDRCAAARPTPAHDPAVCAPPPSRQSPAILP